MWGSTAAARTIHSRWDELAPLVKNRSVRIIQKGGTSLEGKVRSIETSGITLRTNTAAELQKRELSVARDQIQNLYVQKGRGLGRRVATIAAVVAAAGLAALGTAGVLLDAKDAAIAGYTGAAGAAVAAAILTGTAGENWTEIRIIGDTP